VAIGSDVIEIRDAWIEKKSVVKFHLAWFRYRQPTGGYTICLRLARGDVLFQGPDSYYFVDNQSSHLWRLHGLGPDTIVFCADSDQLPTSLSVKIAQSRKDHNPDQASFILSPASA
jgi:hypothetical protein